MLEAEGRAHVADKEDLPQNRRDELEELLFTLEVCRRLLPWDAHPEHIVRLRRIEGMVRWRWEWQTEKDGTGVEQPSSRDVPSTNERCDT